MALTSSEVKEIEVMIRKEIKSFMNNNTIKQYEDQLMDPASAKAIVSAADPVAAFVAERLLFNELAGNDQLLAAMRRAFARVEEFIARRAK